jgi:hypothetical protein
VVTSYIVNLGHYVHGHLLLGLQILEPNVWNVL